MRNYSVHSYNDLDYDIFLMVVGTILSFPLYGAYSRIRKKETEIKVILAQFHQNPAKALIP